MQNPAKHTRTDFVPAEELLKHLKMSTLKSYHELLAAEDTPAAAAAAAEEQYFEVVHSKTKLVDSFPLHVGNAILQQSKLHFLSFIMFMHEHLQPNAYRYAYADTDSICVITTKTGDPGDSIESSMRALFDPILRDDKRDSFYRNWRVWFVLDDSIDEKRAPGKLKVEFQITEGEYFALTNKLYFGYDIPSQEMKKATKGIPHSVKVTADDYRETLFQTCEEPHMVELQQLRLAKDFKMGRFTLLKKGLSDLYSKRHVADDRITCTPYKRDNYL